MTTPITKEQLTDGQIRFFSLGAEPSPSQVKLMAQELEERRKAQVPEIKPANLANKFYERYPLATFKSDSERAEAFGYFMAGAELQCFGGFIKYEDLCGDE